MGQSEVVEVLEKLGRPASRKEIAEILDWNPNKVSSTINRMLKFDELIIIEVDRKVALEQYGCKRRLRLYMIK